MLNCAIIMGRLTKDIELRKTQDGKAVCSFCVAVDRGYGDDKKTDFLNCVAWRHTAEFIEKWFHKGDMIAIQGSIQTRSYESGGHTNYVTEILTENASFCGSKERGSILPDNIVKTENEPILATTDDIDEGLPF